MTCPAMLRQGHLLVVRTPGINTQTWSPRAWEHSAATDAGHQEGETVKLVEEGWAGRPGEAERQESSDARSLFGSPQPCPLITPLTPPPDQPPNPIP